MSSNVNKVADILLEEEKPLDIRYYLNIFHKKLPVILTFFIISITLASIYVAKIPVRYQAVAQLIFEIPTTSWMQQGYQGVASYNPSTDSVVSMRYQDIEETAFKTQKEIMLSPPVLKKVVEALKLTTYFQTDNPASLVGKVRSMITIERKKGSRIIHVTATAESGKLAADLANNVSETFLRESFESALYHDRNILTWLQQGGGGADEYVTITDPLGKATRIKYSEMVESLPPIQSDPTIRELKGRLQEMKSSLESYLRQYREKHPVIIKTQSDIQFIEDSITQEKNRILETLKARAGGQMGETPGRIIEQAQIPKQPVKERRIFIIMMAGILSLVAGGLLVLAMDYFDDTIRIMEDFERKGILLPFLGPLPLIEGTSKVPGQVTIIPKLEDAQNRGAVEEAFRYLRVAINFSAPPETVKTLAVTSCLPGDGKSFVSTNLATSLALDGNRVLLVDGDLRRPVVHRTFEMDNETGISNYLTSHVDLDSVVRNSSVENLWIVCSGPISPNPSEILGSDRMKQFFKEAIEKYDRVIVDCPPLTGIGDGFVVGSLIGHLILVVGAGKTPADLIRHTQQQIDKMSIKILGTVLNRMDLKEERYGSYTHHYYHTYHKYYHRK